MSAYIKDLDAARVKQYYKTLEFDHLDVDKALKTAMSKLVIGYSAIPRFAERIQELLYLYTFSETELICTSFGAKAKGTYAIYALLYSQWDQVKRKYVHRYVVPCPTYRSQDGEYRHRVIPFGQFEALMTRFSDVYDTVEQHVVEQMESEKLEFNTTMFYPKSFTGSENDFENELDGGRFPITLYAHAWLCDFHQIHSKIIENHVNPAYQFIMYRKHGVPVYEAVTKLLEKHGVTYPEFTVYLSELYQNVKAKPQRVHLECGQKIFPLTRNEMIHPGDINFPVWREIYFAKICTDIAVSLLSPSFPVFDRYFYIQNSIHTLYDNPSQHEKFQNGEVSGEINRLLYAADRLNLMKGKHTGTYINSKFYLLSRKIRKAISYSQKNIQLVDVSVCTTTEHTGRTLRDIPVLAHNEKEADLYNGFFGDIETFNKYIFEFMYGLYCVHAKAKLMHGDLHLNNATLYESISYHYINDKNAFVYYIVDDNGKPLIHRFRHTGIFSMIIDMSRGVMADRERLERDFGARYTEMYLKEQNIRVMRMLLHYFPVLTEKHRDRIETLLTSNPELMFKMLVVIDPYALCKNLYGMFVSELPEYPSIKVDPAIPKLLQRIVAICEVMFAEKLTAILNAKITRVEDFDWPCLGIIKELFRKYVVSKAEDVKPDELVADVFNGMNPIKYSTRSYSTMPELLRLDTEMELRTKHGIPIKDDEEALLEFNRDESSKRDLLVQKYREDEVVVSEASSWMFD